MNAMAGGGGGRWGGRGGSGLGEAFVLPCDRREVYRMTGGKFSKKNYRTAWNTSFTLGLVFLP
jgi:hypothetical protein